MVAGSKNQLENRMKSNSWLVTTSSRKAKGLGLIEMRPKSSVAKFTEFKKKSKLVE
jgi:hypothetical protein